MEGLELSPLAPRGRGGHLKSGLMSPCRQEIPLLLKLFLAGSPGWDQLAAPPPRSERSRERSSWKSSSWDRAAACPTRGGIGRAPFPWGLQHQPPASITTGRAPLITHPEEKREKRQEDTSPDLQKKKKPRQMGRVFSTCTVKTTLHQQSLRDNSMWMEQECG